MFMFLIQAFELPIKNFKVEHRMAIMHLQEPRMEIDMDMGRMLLVQLEEIDLVLANIAKLLMLES